jgi:adenosylhomocysteinase
MSFANQALAAEWLLKEGSNLSPGVHEVPKAIDKEIASLKLKSMGAKIDTLTSIQEEYLNSWEHGS